MNPSVIFICLVLAFVALTDANPVRGGWASGATQDRDPEEAKYKQQGQQNADPTRDIYYYKVEGQGADAVADGYNPNVYTYTVKKGANKASIATASGSNSASSFASA